MKDTPRVAIVDYSMGNIFSIKAACESVGMTAEITSLPEEILSADAVILPGVGAFGDAISILRERKLVDPLKTIANSPKPLMGICLGMQLLMTESFEFGHHEGLGIIPGIVTRLDRPLGPQGTLKVPHVCWNKLTKTADRDWEGSLLDGLDEGMFMYFTHSFYVKPVNQDVVIATTSYGHLKFCSALQYRNIFACQGHPERSGKDGLRIYRNLAAVIRSYYG